METGTSSFRFLLTNQRSIQTTTTTALTTRIFGVNASIGELGSRDFTEQMLVRWKDLPFMAKIGKVIQHCNAIASQSLASIKVTQHANTLSKRFLASVLERHLDKLLVSRKDNLLSRINGIQVNLDSILGNCSSLLREHLYGKTSKLGEFSLELKIDPIVSLGIKFNSGTFNLQNVIANADYSILNVAPVSHEFGANVNINAKSIGKVWILGKDKVALSVILKVFILPSLEVRIAIRGRLGTSGMTETCKVCVIGSQFLEFISMKATSLVFESGHIVIGSTSKVNVSVITASRGFNMDIAWSPLHITVAKANVVSFSHITSNNLRDYNLKSIVLVAIVGRFGMPSSSKLAMIIILVPSFIMCAATILRHCVKDIKSPIIISCSEFTNRGSH
mmetsp:Transcript_17334/g.42395  ORF Transcript_17334/g.42395 Transcript_17334/m.42395 type:complete len:391 (-) Transcript_17334:611-1783(-)